MHLVQHGDSQWQHYIGFRDALRRDPKLRQRYSRLKRRLARQFPEDRESYTNSKTAFILEVLKEEA